MLPQERQASLHDAHDGTVQRQPDGLYVRLGEVPVLPGKHLRSSFSNV
jgi:hypothetical protein